MRGPARVARGLLSDASRPLSFEFDGQVMQGQAGDTLAAALLANGRRLVARSFKYHRPRGIFTAGGEEPCALVDVLGPQGREPNRLATTLPLHERLRASSQNRWPSLSLDLGAINDALSRLLPAGFYYKTFMSPGWAWERLYEPLIRRAAGFGTLEARFGEQAEPAETVHDHTDALVVGAGAAGLSAALEFAAAGLNVMLLDQDAVAGGGTLLDAGWDAWRTRAAAALARYPNLRWLPRTTVIGAYGHGVFGALETLHHEQGPRPGNLRERLRVVRARAVILATGSIERLVAFPGNDVPGVMLAGAALSFLRRHGVAVGQRPLLFTNNDEAYEALFALADAGVRCAGIVDSRAESEAAERARARGIEVHTGALVAGIRGRQAVRGAYVAGVRDQHSVHGARGAGIRGERPVSDARAAAATPDRHALRQVEADAVLLSGGFSPASALAVQLGASLMWQPDIAAFVPSLAPETGYVAGAARGVFGLAAASRDGVSVARQVLVRWTRKLRSEPRSRGADVVRAGGTAVVVRVDDAGVSGRASAAGGVSAHANGGAGADRAAADMAASPALSWLADVPPDTPRSALQPLWEVAGRGKAFVDLQNDVSADDVRLAVREGYEHAEHLKRYTTHGMGMDQGRIGGLTGLAVLARARAVELSEVGLTRPRPFATPVPFAALAGGEVREHFKPKRRLPLHAWHEQAGARFVQAGWWLRPLVYSREPGWEPVLAEACAVRERVGITDASSLGKIDVQGPDAAKFLDFIYANTFSTLPVGRARYGIMLREDGILLDDGTTARLGPEHFLLTTTTLNAAAVLEHLEFQWQAHRPQFDIAITDVGDQWAQFAVAGPRSREVVARVTEGVDLSNAGFPFMAAAVATLAGISGRLFRISFSGELAYELAVPAHRAGELWQALLTAGRDAGIVPYGLDALNTLRIEKGHVTGAELSNSSAQDLGFGGMLKGSGDFVGRALAQRPELNAPHRLQLVALRPLEPGARLRNGAQLVTRAARRDSLGFITSSTPSVVRRGWVGLALLADGRRRLGQRLIAASPIHEEQCAVEIMSSHWLDPENRRARA